MASTDLVLWTLDDCIEFVEKCMKSINISDSDAILQAVIESFRKNFVTGSALIKFSDDEWKELIPPMGIRVHIRNQFKKKIQKKKRRLLITSQGTCKGSTIASTCKNFFVLQESGAASRAYSSA